MPFTVKKLKAINTDSLDTLGHSVVDLAKFVEDEFAEVATGMQDTVPDTVWNTPLPRPRRGTYVYADGTHWNPGSGEGPYWFDGAAYHPMGQNAAPGTFVKTIKVQKFTSNGTYTPSAGMIYCSIRGVGGGGGGGGVAGTTNYSLGASGGQAGGYAELLATAATVGVSQVVTIGAFGVGGSPGGNSGAAGGDTSVGTLLVARGGAGGGFTTITYTGPIVNTSAGVGDVSNPGAPGGHGFYVSAAASGVVCVATGGNGGSGPFGSGGRGGQNTTGLVGYGFGSGGGGGANNTGTNTGGGPGTAGLVEIVEYCSQ